MVSEQLVVNVRTLEWTGRENGGGWKRLARAAGGDQLGCTLEVLPPGGRPAPYHYHLANEEAMFVLDGDATLRTPRGERPITTGDYAAFPAGPAGAHTIENTGDDEVRILLMSTMHQPDVIVRPDESTARVIAGVAPGEPREQRTIDEEFHFEASDVESR